MLINKYTRQDALHNVLPNENVRCSLRLPSNDNNEMQILEVLQYRISRNSVEGFMEYINNLNYKLRYIMDQHGCPDN
jgi:hypothetical protein